MQIRHMLWGLVTALLVTGCTITPGTQEQISKQGASVIKVTPTQIGSAYDVSLGKEYESFEFEAEFDTATCPGHPKRIVANAYGVSGMNAQAVAAGAVVALQESLTEQGIEIANISMEGLTEVMKTYLQSINPATGLPLNSPGT